MKEKKEDIKGKGQSTIEYIILAATVIACLLFFLRPGGFFGKAYNGIIQQQGDDMLGEAKAIFN